MKSINRYVTVIKLRQPFLDWINALPDTEEKLTIADLQSDCTAVLIPEFDLPEGSRGFLDSLAEGLFEEELAGWCTDEAHWPRDRTRQMFWEWCDVEVHSEVLDAGQGPIKKKVI